MNKRYGVQATNHLTTKQSIEKMGSTKRGTEDSNLTVSRTEKLPTKSVRSKKDPTNTRNKDRSICISKKTDAKKPTPENLTSPRKQVQRNTKGTPARVETKQVSSKGLKAQRVSSKRVDGNKQSSLIVPGKPVTLTRYEETRKENWEAGNPDICGVDTFDNILAHLMNKVNNNAEPEKKNTSEKNRRTSL